MDDQHQLDLIRKAHESRARDRIKGGTSTLTFFQTDFDCRGLQLLAEQRPDLVGLYLMQTKVTDDGFEAINSFSHLEQLDITNAAITESGIQKIDRRLPLRTFNLATFELTPTVSQFIASFETLRDLNAANRMKWPNDPSDQGVTCFAAAQQLEVLSLRGRILDGTCLPAIATLTSLKSLDLAWTQTPAEALRELCQLTKLQELGLGKTGLTDDVFESLTCLKEITHLDISETSITDRSIRLLPLFPNLKDLFLEDVTVSREALEVLRELPNLEFLEADIDGVDHSFFEDLALDNPKLWVHP